MSTLRAQRETLEELWEQGLSGQALLAEQSRLADQFIVDHFEKVSSAEHAGNVAVIALGGYGRRELFPYSDIDLLILFREEVREAIGPVVDGVLYPLWDTGLDVGHGVRTVGECLEHVADDFYFQVALLDARLLAGSDALFCELQEKYRSAFVDGAREDFVGTMKQFMGSRRKRYGSHSYLLEPNIKESRGGMRDIQAMLWTANVVFGLHDVEAVADAGILLQEEKESFVKSWNMLIRIRNRLHYISRRKNEQLYFEQQEEMAAAFGYQDSPELLAVESFMRDTYGHLQTIAVTSDQFFEHVGDVLGLSEGKAKVDKYVEKGIELRNGRVHLLAKEEELQARPYLLMRLFLAASKCGCPVHHRSRKIVTANLDLIGEKQRSSARMIKPFFQLLESGDSLLMVLELMLESGLLSAFIPEFGRIESLAQHDVYHIYTVDRHLLQSVVELRQVMAAEEQVFEKVSSPRVLLLATLLHDIGKGAGDDHSVVGTELVSRVGQRLGFNQEECSSLEFVVRFHLFLPESALRRDLNDETFIRHCAETIGTSDRLAMLYLVSVADSRATGPSAWSDWKGSLLQELYLKALPYLELGRTFDYAQHADQGVDWLRSQVNAILSAEPKARAFVEDLPSDYLLSFTPEAIAGHVRLHAEHSSLLQQRAMLFPVEMRSQWSLLVVCRDQVGLLAKVCGVLILHNLSVLNAQVFTWECGSAVDLLEVHADSGMHFEDIDWQAVENDLNLALTHRLGLGHRLYKKLQSYIPKRKVLPGVGKTRVLIDNDGSEKYTIVEVYSPDCPGQLYRITQALADFGVGIYRAYIATEVDQLIDVFYVQDSRGQKILDEAFVKELRDGVLYSVSGKV